jgi:processive 1,2-diacylglycerol beta-glucosyltransferase
MNFFQDPSPVKRVLILSVSAGAGHLRAAEALRETARTRFPDVELEHLDFLDFTTEAFRRFYADSYDYLVERQPSLWKYLYEFTDKPKTPSKLQDFRRAIENLNVRGFKKRLKAFAPDAVICTHFLPAQYMARRIRKQKFDRPVWVVVTDFDVHTLWLQECMTGYFAAAEEVAWRMRDRGIDPASLRITGIPVMPAFSSPLPREECARELGLDPRRLTVLLMAGAKGTERAHRMAERLLQIEAPFQIVAIAGRNEKLLKNLQTLAESDPLRLFPIGFTKTIERAMAASDLAITKPGGLISSECLAMGLPMILVFTIPGQEERNATHLLEHQVALEAYDEAGLEFRVAALVRDPERLSAMKQKARDLGKPDAAIHILQTVLERGPNRTGTD